MAQSYPLEPILNMRQRRLDAAQNKQRAAKHQVEVAKDKVRKSKDALEQFKVFKEEEINRRYDKIMYTTMSQLDMQKFNQSLADLDKEELSKIEHINQSEQELTKAKENLDFATAHVFEAKKALMKLQVHKDLFMQQQRIEMEREADKEMEDFKPKKQYSFD